MCYKSRAIHFEHEYVVHNPYLATLHELYPSLMAKCVNGEAYAVAGIYMPRLGEETDVERQACHITRCLRWIKASDTLSRARVVPLPLLHVAAKFGVGLCDWCHNHLSKLNGGNSRCINLSRTTSSSLRILCSKSVWRWRIASGKSTLRKGLPQSLYEANRQKLG